MHDPVGKHGLKVVCLREPGVDIDKGNQTSDWAQRPLSSGQIDYAALDVELLLGLYDIFSKAEAEGLFG